MNGFVSSPSFTICWSWPRTFEQMGLVRQKVISRYCAALTSAFPAKIYNMLKFRRFDRLSKLYKTKLDGTSDTERIGKKLFPYRIISIAQHICRYKYLQE